ncbi:MAG: hypothetical protein V3R25_05795 [Nitrosomonadaceae bacterium]
MTIIKKTVAEFTQSNTIRRRRRHSIGFNLIGGEAPVVLNTVEDFGALTLIDEGDLQLSATNGPTAWAITGGTASTQYKVNNSGVLQAKVTGPTAGTIFVTATNDAGTSPAETITISTPANSYSVGTTTQFTSLMNTVAINLGEAALLRGVTFGVNSSTTVINRTTAPIGSFTGSNHFVVKPHTGASPIVKFIDMNGVNGGAKFFEFDGFIVERNHGESLIHADAVFTIRGAASDIIVKNCTIQTNDWSNGSGPVDLPFAIELINVTDILIIDNTFLRCYDGVNADDSSDITVTTNTMRQIGNDYIKIAGTTKAFDNFLVNGNLMTDLKEFSSGAHRDFYQIINVSTNSVNVDVVANIMQPGVTTAFGAGTGGIQGIFRNAGGDTTTVSGNIDGNVIILDNPNGIFLDFFTNTTVRNNTVIMDPVESSVGNFSKIEYRNTDNVTVENNVSSAFGDISGNTNLTETNNQIADRSAVSPVTNSYEELFFDPVTETDDATVDYAYKSGGLLDVADPKIGGPGVGTGVDYANGTYTPPYTEALTTWELADHLNLSGILQQSGGNVTNGPNGLIFFSAVLGALPIATGNLLDAPGAGIFIERNTLGTIRVRVEDTAGGTMIDKNTGATVFANERINILIAVVNGGTCKAYIEGSSTGSVTLTQTATSVDMKFDYNEWGIGSNSGGSAKFTAFEFARYALFKLPSAPPDVATSAVQDDFFNSTTKETVDPTISQGVYSGDITDFFGNATKLNAGTDSSGEGNDFTMTGTVVDV